MDRPQDNLLKDCQSGNSGMSRPDRTVGALPDRPV